MMVLRVYLILSLMMIGAISLMVHAAESEQRFDPEDVQGVRQACLDYVEGFYDADQARMEQGVHPDLAKREVAAGDVLSNMTRKQLITAATNGFWKKPAISVEIYDISGNIASAMVKSDFVDYVHLAKLKGRWQVVNVLWR